MQQARDDSTVGSVEQDEAPSADDKDPAIAARAIQGSRIRERRRLTG